MLEKNQMIKNYITQVASKANEQYQGLIDDDKINKAMGMFADSTEEYDTIVQRINELVNQVIQNYLKEQEKRFDPKLVKENHEEIYSKLEVLIRKLNEKGVDYQLAGALCAYIKYGVESNRTHDDIDINLNESDMNKFKEICEEIGLQFHDNRLTTPRILKNGIPYGEHEVIATLDGSDFHIGAFCFERKPDGTVINKGYYHDENGQIFSRNDIISPQLASEIFGKEQVEFRGQKLFITPPEYIYKLKSYTHNSKDKVDLLFMESRIDRDKLARINELSKTSHIEHKKINNAVNFTSSQNFNYHTHTYRSGHSEYVSDEEILETAKQMGFTSLGFSEHIPNPSLMLPDEDNRMLLSEVGEYISSINKMKNENPNMTILAGFEAEFDPMKESFIGEMRDKVDYMILGQHFVTRGLQNVPAKNNPNYPIEYANMVSKAIDSGIFDIVAHPDLFMQFRDSMQDEESKKLFDENSVLASQIICEKARDMGIPIEINLSPALKNQILSDGNLTYPHPTFWQVAQEIDGLQVLKGVDAHYLSEFKNVTQTEQLIGEIEQLVSDKLIQGSYNPVIARQNNPKLQEAYRTHQESALTFETHMIKQIVDGSLTNAEDRLDAEGLAITVGASLNGIMQNCVNNASKKDQDTIEEMSKIVDNPDISHEEKKGKFARKKMAVQETNQVLANQQKAIENAKEHTLSAMNIGCETKLEYSSIVAQITQHETTKSDSQKQQIEQHIDNFGQSKGIISEKGKPYQLTRTNSNQNNADNANRGSVNIVVLTLIMSFIIGFGIGIGYMIYSFSIGG